MHLQGLDNQKSTITFEDFLYSLSDDIVSVLLWL